jgi:hypothetical protein
MVYLDSDAVLPGSGMLSPVARSGEALTDSPCIDRTLYEAKRRYTACIHTRLTMAP